MKNDLKELFKELTVDLKNDIKSIKWLKQLNQFIYFVIGMLGFAYIFEHKNDFLELTSTEVIKLIIAFLLLYISVMIILFMLKICIELIVDAVHTYIHYKEHDIDEIKEKEDKHLK